MFGVGITRCILTLEPAPGVSPPPPEPARPVSPQGLLAEPLSGKVPDDQTNGGES